MAETQGALAATLEAAKRRAKKQADSVLLGQKQTKKELKKMLKEAESLLESLAEMLEDSRDIGAEQQEELVDMHKAAAVHRNELGSQLADARLVILASQGKAETEVKAAVAGAGTGARDAIAGSEAALEKALESLADQVLATSIARGKEVEAAKCQVVATVTDAKATLLRAISSARQLPPPPDVSTRTVYGWDTVDWLLPERYKQLYGPLQGKPPAWKNDPLPASDAGGGDTPRGAWAGAGRGLDRELQLVMQEQD